MKNLSDVLILLVVKLVKHACNEYIHEIFMSQNWIGLNILSF